MNYKNNLIIIKKIKLNIQMKILIKIYHYQCNKVNNKINLWRLKMIMKILKMILVILVKLIKNKNMEWRQKINKIIKIKILNKIK